MRCIFCTEPDLCNECSEIITSDFQEATFHVDNFIENKETNTIHIDVVKDFIMQRIQDNDPFNTGIVTFYEIETILNEL